MKNIREEINKFEQFDPKKVIKEQENYLSNSAEIHNILLSNHGGVLASIQAFYKMMGDTLENDRSDFPDEAEPIFREVAELLNKIEKPLRKKVIRIYSLLSGDYTLEDDNKF